MMNEKVEVKVIAYGHLKVVCGFETKNILVPTDCVEAFRFVTEWLREEYEIDTTSVFLMFNEKNANEKTHAGYNIKNGDVFRLMTRMSGG